MALPGLHRTLSAIPCRATAVRAGLDPRDQARRLSADGPSRSVGIRLITRRGNDWSHRFPLVVEAVNHLKVRSCLIDGEVVCCDERGWPPFSCSAIAGTSPRHSSTPSTCWNSTAKTCAASRSRCARRRWPASCAEQHGVRLNEHLEHECGLTSSSTPARWGWRDRLEAAWARAIGRAARRDWLKFKNPEAPAVRREAEEDWANDD